MNFRNGGRIASVIVLVGALQGCRSADRFQGEPVFDAGEEGDSLWNSDAGADSEPNTNLDCSRDTDTIIEGRYEWHTFFDHGGRDDIILDSEMDAEGNFYILGTSTRSDVYVLKFSATGEFLSDILTVRFAESMAVDESGNIFLCGSSEPWDGPAGELPKHPHAIEDSSDIFVLKLDPNGAYIWHTFFGGADNDEGTALTLDRDGNIIVAGISTYSWNGPSGETPLFGAVSSGPDFPILLDDLVVLKLDAEGAYRWHGFYGGGYFYHDRASSLKTDEDSNIFLTGSSDGGWSGPDNRAPIHPHGGSPYGTIGEGLADILVLKLSPTGSYQWHTFFGSGSTEEQMNCYTDYGHDLTIDNSGDIVVSASAGSCTETSPWPGDAPLHPHSPEMLDMAILKLNAGGDLLWHTFYPGAAGAAHSVDRNGNIYITGNAAGTWDGPNGEAPRRPYSEYGENDALVLKLSPAGEYQWHGFYGANPTIDYSGHQDVLSVASLGVGTATETGRGHAVFVDGCGKAMIWGYADYPWQGPSGESPIAAHAFESWCEISYILEYPDHTDVAVMCGGYSDLFALGLD